MDEGCRGLDGGEPSTRFTIEYAKPWSPFNAVSDYLGTPCPDSQVEALSDDRLVGLHDERRVREKRVVRNEC